MIHIAQAILDVMTPCLTQHPKDMVRKTYGKRKRTIKKMRKFISRRPVYITPKISHAAEKYLQPRDQIILAQGSLNIWRQ